MTDPIRIPIDGSHGAQDAWQHTLTITPDLARQIVALAADPSPATPPADPLPADTSDGDAAAITALARILAFAHHSTQAVEVLAAIKAGEVPGICTTAERDKALADLAAETDAKHRALTCAADYAERAEADNREIHRLANIVADDGEKLATLTAQRDRLAGLLRIVADRHEHGQPIPSREIAAALAELEKTK